MMTDKRDAVIEAARALDRGWRKLGRCLGPRSSVLRRALAAMDSPLPSDEDLRDVYHRGYKREDPGVHIARDTNGFRAARNAVHASGLALAATECLRLGGEGARSIAAHLDRLAEEMETR